MKVVFITSDIEDPSARLRVSNYLAPLGEAGLEARARELPRSSRARWRLFRSLPEHDVVVLHRKLFSFLELSFLRRNSRTLVYDFDDAMGLRVPWQSGRPARARTRRFRRTVAWSDGLLPGSNALREMAGPVRVPVHVLPTPVNLDRAPAPSPARPSGTVLGWIGQESSLPYLEALAPALERLARSVPDLRLRVIADAPVEVPGVFVEPVAWTEEGEWEALAGVDVGLAPLTDDAWSRGKCAFKVLQYFAAGRPVVASPVGMNAEVVTPEETGLWARTEDEWVSALAGLLPDAGRRQRMGEAGRRLVEERYGLRGRARELCDFLWRVRKR